MSADDAPGARFPGGVAVIREPLHSVKEACRTYDAALDLVTRTSIYAPEVIRSVAQWLEDRRDDNPEGRMCRAIATAMRTCLAELEADHGALDFPTVWL